MQLNRPRSMCAPSFCPVFTASQLVEVPFCVIATRCLAGGQSERGPVLHRFFFCVCFVTNCLAWQLRLLHLCSLVSVLTVFVVPQADCFVAVPLPAAVWSPSVTIVLHAVGHFLIANPSVVAGERQRLALLRSTNQLTGAASSLPCSHIVFVCFQDGWKGLELGLGFIKLFNGHKRNWCFVYLILM